MANPDKTIFGVYCACCKEKYAMIFLSDWDEDTKGSPRCTFCSLNGNKVGDFSFVVL
jgi:hypothetical protein